MKRISTGNIGILAVALAVALLQDAGVQAQLQPPVSVPGVGKQVVVVTGRIRSNTTFTSNLVYVLRGPVFVENNATLTIEPGTLIAGELATLGTLIIAQGARIVANGTADAPIVFTSDQPVGSRARGDWGGLIINGRAPINLPGGVGLGEGDTGVYGGDDPNDDSGVLRYVRVEFAGIEFSPDNELNGIAFQGVGRGTTVDHIQVKANKDDGIEFFGGTVDARHVVLNMIGDDSIDWTFGWSGRMQYVIVHQRGDDADNGIEADNNGNNNNLLPRSNPTIYNLTLIGDPDSAEGSESDDGMLLREGTAGRIGNFIVLGFKEWGVNVDHAATVQQIASGALTLANGIVHLNGLLPNRGAFDGDATALLNPSIAVGEDPGLVDPFNHRNPNYRPAGIATLAGGQLQPAVPPNDGFFDVTTFVGALSPDPEQDWTRGWTDFSEQ